MLRQSLALDFCMVIDCQGEFSLLPIVDVAKVTEFWVKKEKKSKQRGKSNSKKIDKHYRIIEKAI